MAVLFAFMVPGFALKKLKMLGEGATLTLSNILLYVCQPALVIKAFCIFSEEDAEIIYGIGTGKLLANFGVTAAISFIAMFFVFGISKLVFIKMKNKKAANVYSFVAVFSNCGFLGIPFVEMFTDGNPLAVMYMMVFNVGFNILCWTLGIVLLTGSFKEIRLKKLALNPAILTILIGLLLFFVPQINIFSIKGLEVIRMFPQYLAYMTAPVSMLIVGIRVAETPLKQLFCKKGVYAAGALRLVVAPFLTFVVAIPFYFLLTGVRGALSTIDEYVFLAPVIAMAMSPAASVVAMAERFDGDREEATATFVTNTIISVIIVPLVIMAVMACWGVLAG